MTGGVDRVARVRAFRTEELTSRDRKVHCRVRVKARVIVRVSVLLG